MVAVTRYTAPRTPCPGYGSTCPQARPETPSQNDGVYHLDLLQRPLEEHVMASHQGHQSGASALVSRALLVSQQPRPVDASLHVEVSPLTALVVYITPPHVREVPNLHMHQTSNNKWY
jgi:hypothetical protein